MKTTHKLLWIAFLLCFTGIANAQDVIVKKDNSTILSKVLEISSTEIKYKKWSNQEGPTYSISVSEVASINYQNGDVEKFSANANNQTYTNRPQQPQTSYSGHMDIKGTHLTIKGLQLSDEEVCNLVDPLSYQKYLKAKKLHSTATVFISIGLVSLTISSAIITAHTKNNNYENMEGAAITGIIGGIALIPGFAMNISGNSKMHQVVEDYNNKHSQSYSFNISPSLMRCETPQSQGNCGLGLTLSFDF